MSIIERKWKKIITLFITAFIFSGCASNLHIDTQITILEIDTQTYKPTETNSKTPTSTFTSTITSSFTPTSTSTITLTPDYSRTITKQVRLIYYTGWDGSTFTHSDPRNDKTAYIDVDTMELGNTPKSDLYFNVSIGSMLWYWLNAINGAQEWSKGKIDVRLKDCYNDSLPNDELESDTYVGNHVCVISNNNRLFLVYIEHINFQYEYATIYLKVTTYK
jgi:hypothetical protein